MSAAIMPVAATATSPARRLRSHASDFRRRVSLRSGEFSFVRTDRAKDVRAIPDRLAVCRVTYRPVAGHRAGRRQVKELSENRNIFVWLAPIADTRVVMPLRVSFESKVGTFVVQATHFASGQAGPRDALMPCVD
jgi:hypothetical protein